MNTTLITSATWKKRLLEVFNFDLCSSLYSLIGPSGTENGRRGGLDCTLKILLIKDPWLFQEVYIFDLLVGLYKEDFKGFIPVRPFLFLGPISPIIILKYMCFHNIPTHKKNLCLHPFLIFFICLTICTCFNISAILSEVL